MSTRDLIEGEAMLDDDEENEEELPDDYEGQVRNGPPRPNNADDSSEEDDEEDDEEAARAVGLVQNGKRITQGDGGLMETGARRVHRRRG